MFNKYLHRYRFEFPPHQSNSSKQICTIPIKTFQNSTCRTRSSRKIYTARGTRRISPTQELALRRLSRRHRPNLQFQSPKVIFNSLYQHMHTGTGRRRQIYEKKRISHYPHSSRAWKEQIKHPALISQKDCTPVTLLFLPGRRSRSFSLQA